MFNIVAITRSRLKMEFRRLEDNALFDPQIVLFEATFAPATRGVPETKYSYMYNTDPEIVRTGVGVYYVEQLFDTVGRMKFTWRSTAFGEELTMEEIANITARTVV